MKQYRPGVSLRVWRDFFPNAVITGWDIDSKAVEMAKRWPEEQEELPSSRIVTGRVSSVDKAAVDQWMAQQHGWTSDAYRCRLLQTEVFAGAAPSSARKYKCPPHLGLRQEQDDREGAKSPVAAGVKGGHESADPALFGGDADAFPKPFGVVFGSLEWRARVQTCRALWELCEGVWLHDHEGREQGEPPHLQRPPHQMFDLIIDDGFHSPRANLASLSFLWPYLSAERLGVYIIEDLTIPGTHFMRAAENVGKFTFFLENMVKKHTPMITNVEENAEADEQNEDQDHADLEDVEEVDPYEQRRLVFHPFKTPYFGFTTSLSSGGSGVVLQKTVRSEQMIPLDQMPELVEETEDAVAFDIVTGEATAEDVAEDFCWGRVDEGANLLAEPLARMRGKAVALTKEYLERSDYAYEDEPRPMMVTVNILQLLLSAVGKPGSGTVAPYR
eukprot:g2800.t1